MLAAAAGGRIDKRSLMSILEVLFFNAPESCSSIVKIIHITEYSNQSPKETPEFAFPSK
jgi:hypothetical protein